MDVYFQLDGIFFVWRDEKAALNLVKYDVRFQNAAEIFLDPMLAYADARSMKKYGSLLLAELFNGECSSPSTSSTRRMVAFESSHPGRYCKEKYGVSDEER